MTYRNTMEIIEVEDEETWPNELLTFLEENKAKYLSWKGLIKDKAVSGFEYDEIIKRLENILKNYAIIGYHATRLTDFETGYIHENGMFILSEETTSYRLKTLRDNNLISDDEFLFLKSNNWATDECRTMQLWFCFTSLLLQDEHGVVELFTKWGGEAIYRAQDGYKTLGKLKSIGTPCIVKAIVPISSLKLIFLPEKIYGVFIQNRKYNADIDTTYEGFSEKPIPKENIIDIIKYPSPAFIDLTNCNKWDVVIS